MQPNWSFSYPANLKHRVLGKRCGNILPLISIPLVAPTPVPTITAVGVAKPKAQGHAMAKTVKAIRKEYCQVISSLLNPSRSIRDTGNKSLLT